MNIKKLLKLSAVGIVSLSLISGCGLQKKSLTHDTYAFVAKDVQNPYMIKVYDGFKNVCSEIGVASIFTGSDSANAAQQIDIINDLISRNVTGIAVAANDRDAMTPSLQTAIKQGIKVISLDSAVNKDARMTHIQQADPEKIGRSLIHAAYEITNGNGGIAILSSAHTATNQNLWIEWMKKELDENKSKYVNMPLLKIAYGDDNPDKSKAEVQSLLQNKKIKVIISPTTVGIVAAAEVISSQNSDVKLTGLGLPSEMEQYVKSGICPQMYLWNPIDIGSLAGYTLDALSKEEITGAEGETFMAGALGEKEITDAADGGTEVMLGEPFKFDINNIDKWIGVY